VNQHLLEKHEKELVQEVRAKAERRNEDVIQAEKNAKINFSMSLVAAISEQRKI